MVENVTVLGIDPSFAATGYWVRSIEGSDFGGSVKFSARGEGERLAQVEEFFYSLLEHLLPDYAAIEGYAMGQQGRRETAGELGGVIRLCLYHHGVGGYYLVPPRTLKKFVTGRGNSSKEDVVSAVRDRWGWDFSEDDNQADAYALCRAGEAMWSGFEEGELCEQACRWVDL